MLNGKGIWLGFLLTAWLPFNAVQADGIQDFVLSQLDGKGTVNSVDASANKIVIDDRLYILSRTVTVFDVTRRTNSSVSDIKPGNTVGFKAEPLPKPTAPYNQVIVKIWILPSDKK